MKRLLTKIYDYFRPPILPKTYTPVKVTLIDKGGMQICVTEIPDPPTLRAGDTLTITHHLQVLSK